MIDKTNAFKYDLGMWKSIANLDFHYPATFRMEILMFARLSGLLFLCVLLFITGCGGPSSTVTGRVTCNGKAVVGSIMFSPKGEGPDNTGPAVEAVLDSDGKYTAKLKSVGSHRVRIAPSDIPYPAVPGKEYPCDLSTLEKDVKAGTNDITIDLAKRK